MTQCRPVVSRSPLSKRVAELPRATEHFALDSSADLGCSRMGCPGFRLGGTTDAGRSSAPRRDRGREEDILTLTMTPRRSEVGGAVASRQRTA